MLEIFKNHIAQKFPFLQHTKLLIAVSGGVDSVTLCHLCHQLHFNITLAHCNFNLRANESMRDEKFIIRLAKILNIEVFTKKFDTLSYAKTNKCSIQMAARELRYNWFSELATQHHFDSILTAHHADDNLETFLINFLRGTGLNGLTGIPDSNANIVRPLLPFSRQQIKTYAKIEAFSWREDSSNTSRKYLRNKIRRDVVPILKSINPQLLDSFKSTLDHLNETAAIVAQAKNNFLDAVVKSKTDEHTGYNISEFKTFQNPKPYLYECFKDFGFTQWQDILKLLDAENGKYVISKTHQLIKHRELLILRPLTHINKYKNAIQISEHQTSIETPLGVLFLKKGVNANKNSVFTIFVDTSTLEYPLEFRPWITEDVFHPKGMQGQRKKVSKFLKDEKLSPIEKDNTWVLTSRHRIVWVVGKRTDERFKVQEDTKNITSITLRV